MTRTYIIANINCIYHKTPDGHPEAAARLAVLLEAFRQAGIEWVEAAYIGRDTLQRGGLELE